MDVVVTVPKRLWKEWIAEGDLPGEPETGRFYYYKVRRKPRILEGQRLYIVAFGKLRGYAPLHSLTEEGPKGPFFMVRQGGAVAVTIHEYIPGWQGFRYRWWNVEDEIPFPDWMNP